MFSSVYLDTEAPLNKENNSLIYIITRLHRCSIHVSNKLAIGYHFQFKEEKNSGHVFQCFVEIFPFQENGEIEMTTITNNIMVPTYGGNDGYSEENGRSVTPVTAVRDL